MIIRQRKFSPSTQTRALFSIGCLLIVFCFSLWLLNVGWLPATAEQAALPSIDFDSSTNTISIGINSSSQAAHEVIDLPRLAAYLSDQGLGTLLIAEANQQWLLKANLVIKRSARLDVTATTASWLKLYSPPAAAVVITAERGGHLYIEGTKVTSWSVVNDDVDVNVADGRSYLLALYGARLDILQSEMAFLGAGSGEPSGLSWRKRLEDDDPTTGATGRVEDSKIHDNYFGIYTYEAYGIQILRNQVYDNLYYGIDPHDDSRGFEVAHNKVFGNGTHGIIFSRRCIENRIHHNEVYNNADHGIMLDRGTNQNEVYANTVYGNQDGIVIFQSSENRIYDNVVRDNQRGVRINATYDADDPYDGLSANNVIENNQIQDSAEHGVYLYARADRNIIRANQILRSGLNGVYVKSGGNRFMDNTIVDGNVGMTIVGGEYRTDPPVALPALDPSGDNNVIVGTTVQNNRDVGIRILGGSHNRIGPSEPNEGANQIENNGKDGVAIGDSAMGTAATNNEIIKNSIRGNIRHGVLVTDQSSVRNRISLNSITGNGQLGIKIDRSAQMGIVPPVITTTAPEYVRGTAQALAVIEVYSDPGDSGQRLLFTVPATVNDALATIEHEHSPSVIARRERVLYAYSLADYEGQTYLGSVTADDAGVWSFPLPANQDPDLISALAIDRDGNTSAFSGSLKGGSDASYEITLDDNGQKTIKISGIGAIVTLQDIAANLGPGDLTLLQDLGNGLWLLNANLYLEIGVTLNLSVADGVTEVRLRSQANPALVTTAQHADRAAIDYSSFVYIRTYNGEINIDGVKIFSWDAQANDYDRDYTNGRAYLLAKYDAVMNVRDAEIGYLGSDDGESYGLTWRDVNDSIEPDLLRTRVTGEVLNSRIHHNYYGIYTFQAGNMLFRGNHFYENIRYGFDPHDFSHDFLVEENQAYHNGAHGFILSRGCNNFVLRNNISFNNSDPSPSSLAHGFMLDPGSPNSQDPQSPSYENLFENNEAYGNEGYGIRILGSRQNEIRNNHFHDNEIGVSVEDDGIDNLLVANRLSGNRRYGIFIQETADSNVVRANTVMTNSDNGIYIRSSENQIEANMVGQNGKAGIALLIKSGFPLPTANQIISNTIAGNQNNGIDLRTAQRTQVVGNSVTENQGDGIYLKDGSLQNTIINNCLCGNAGFGIEINGGDTLQNLWARNQIYENQRGGIGAGGGALLLSAPTLTGFINGTVTGISVPGATVEIYADAAGQGQYYLGSTIADNNGEFRYVHHGDWPAAYITALVFDENGNASGFSQPLVAGEGETPTPTPTVTPTATPNNSPATPTPSKIFLPQVQS